MHLQDRVEYQTGIAEFGFGKVAAYDPETEMVTVTDEEDGSTWRGPADMATLIAAGPLR